ncbi:alpha/beta hydrolase [Kibdelosporangium philippinense]|uniref:Alpha/beta hydrolase n=1 Tax=Kibdelosporangium philippinense TaxID=211113 RepID=A0ABS8Z126_9PSEU|nr:alpha/beta hydrolase [Kibdelosporangium philippinense]MCE7001470.1 alpha/beta hydrolase [Kibdelosporangium philippinense]
MKAKTSDGASIAISVHGPADGSLVVLSHGWAAGRGVWDSVVPQLVDAGLRVVTYDQRGHGESTEGISPIGIARFAMDLGDVLAAVNASDAVVVGHSGGGFAALCHAITDSSRIAGLVLLATAAHEQNTPKGEVRLMGNPMFSFAIRRGALGRKMISSTVGSDISRDALEAHRSLFAGTSRKVRAACFGCTSGMDLRPGLASVSVPAVLLHGEADTVIKPELGRVVAETLPKADFEEIPRAGHMLPLEAPDRVVRAILELTSR